MAGTVIAPTSPNAKLASKANLTTWRSQQNASPAQVESMVFRKHPRQKILRANNALRVSTTCLRRKRPLTRVKIVRLVTGALRLELTRTARAELACLESTTDRWDKQARRRALPVLLGSSNHTLVFLLHWSAEIVLVARTSSSQDPPSAYLARQDSTDKTRGSRNVSLASLVNTRVKLTQHDV